MARDQCGCSSNKSCDVGSDTGERGALIVGGRARAARDGAPAVTTDRVDAGHDEQKDEKNKKRMAAAAVH